MRWGSWAVAVVVALGGACGSDGDQTERETTSTASGPATVEQYAAIISDHSPELLEVIDTANGCLEGYEFPCDGAQAITVYRVTLQASLLARDLRTGEMPADIEALVERTLAATEAAQLQAQAFDDGNCGPQPGVEASPAASCSETAQFARLANEELKAALLAWEAEA
jgi:hypothetical protein